MHCFTMPVGQMQSQNFCGHTHQDWCILAAPRKLQPGNKEGAEEGYEDRVEVTATLVGSVCSDFFVCLMT